MLHLISLLLIDERYRKARFATAMALFVIIVLIGSIPGARAEIGNLASGIVLHSLAYGGLTLLLFTGTTGTRSERAIKAVIAIMAMGAIDELVQAMLPYRVGSLGDWLVDSIASVVTAGLSWCFLPQPALVRQGRDQP